MHIVASLDEKRHSLPEYNTFRGLKFEVQIRSILQHAWAEIEHDLGYKAKIEVPEHLRRGFNRIAALLESADIEFDRLSESLKNYENIVESKIKNNPKDVELNKLSLVSFNLTNPIVLELDRKITSFFGYKLNKDNAFGGTEIRKLNYFNIHTIDQLSATLASKHEILLKFVSEFAEPKKSSKTFHRGISVFYLSYLLIAEKKDKKEVEEFIEEMWPRDSIMEVKKLAQRIITAFNKATKNTL